MSLSPDFRRAVVSAGALGLATLAGFSSSAAPEAAAVAAPTAVPEAQADEAAHATAVCPEGYPALAPIPSSGGFAANLLSSAVIFITLGVLIAIALYVLWPFRPDEIFPNGNKACTPMDWPWIPCWWDNWKSILAPIAGMLIAVAAACVFALVNRKRTNPDEVNPEVYGELRARLETVGMLVDTLCPGSEYRLCPHSAKVACCAACAEARERRNFITGELKSHGARWVIGTGYVDLYRQLNAIESALLLVQPATEVAAAGLYDSLRLDGADKLPNRTALQDNIRTALPLIGAPIALTGASATAGSVPAEPQPAPTPPTLEEQALGRALLRDVRKAIGEFRDGERASLVRARNQLVWTGTFTAVAGYVLMVLAMLRGVSPASVSTGFVYYVVGALVGLFNQLRTESATSGSEEDFGFRRARLFYVPVLSGLAAVGGVLVVSLLYDAVDFGAGETEARSLGDIYNVQEFQLGLVIAAVFGLTPDLLVNRLQQKADEYQSGLVSTTAASNGSPAKG